MVECMSIMLKYFIDCIPYIFGIYLIFRFIGDLLFGGK